MRYLEKSWWTFLIKSSSFVQSESKLIHFFESRFLDESKLIHSGVYVNLYVYPPWLSSLWTGTCFASIACGHPHAHFWGVPQTPALFLRDDSDGLSCIPLPVSHKHRHYRHHRHLKQASRFNLRLACFILSNVAVFLPHCLLKWI